MILRFTLAILLTVYLFSSCSSSRKASSAVFSTAEFPFIEAFHEGNRYKLRGQYDEAIASFEKCLTYKTDQDAVYYVLSELYLLKNQAQRSAECIKKAAELDPKNKWYVQELAYMYFDQKNYPEAIRNFEKLVKLEPQNIEWLYGYAESLSKGGKTGDAIKALDRMENELGVQPELSIQKFKLYIDSRQESKAIEEVQKALKVYPENTQLLGTLMADVYRQQGKMKEALNELIKAFRSEEVDLDTKMKILISFQELNYKIEPEMYELVDIMVSMYPFEAKAHSIHGDYLNTAGKTKEALEAYKEALKYDKDQYPIWKQVLIMEYEATDFKALYEDSRSCLEYFPTIPTVYLLHGLAANQTKNFAIALETLNTGKDLIINDVALEAEMYGQIGEAYFGLAKIDEGKENFDKALKLDPESLLLKNNYAYQLANSKTDLDVAEKMIDDVLKKESRSGQFLDTKGWVLFQKGKYNDAVRILEDAYHIQPSDKYITEHLGDAHAKNGNIPSALEFWKRALELGSENKILKKKIEKKEYYDPIY